MKAVTSFWNTREIHHPHTEVLCTCRVINNGGLSGLINILTGVRQGYLLSPFLFLLVIDWIMQQTTEKHHDGTQWTLTTWLEDLDFADDRHCPPLTQPPGQAIQGNAACEKLSEDGAWDQQIQELMS